MKLLLSPLLLMSGLICLQVALTSTQPSFPQRHTQSITHNTVKAKHTPFAMPPESTRTPTNPPSDASLGLGADKQHWIDVAWKDAIDAESNKSDTTFPMLYVRQIRQESGFRTDAISGAGAIGIAQFIPSTASGLGVNPYDPVSSLRGGARLMVSYIHKYRSYALALAAYNAGSGTVNACLATDDWFSCLPGETQHYITVILG